MSDASAFAGVNRDTTGRFSSRFTRAAAAERTRLRGRLEKAKAKVRKCKGDLAAAEAGAAEIEGQIEALDSLVDPAPPGPEAGSRLDPAVLCGKVIREVAIEVLLERGLVQGPIHYRQWLALVEAAGYRVAGKRPEAVFLNQVTRSPVVKASGRTGFYEVDPGAKERLAERVAELQRALAAPAADEARDPARLGDPDSRSHELSLGLARARRALHEARAALPEQPATAAGETR